MGGDKQEARAREVLAETLARFEARGIPTGILRVNHAAYVRYNAALAEYLVAAMLTFAKERAAPSIRDTPNGQ